MEAILVFIVKLFSGNKETYDLNEGALIIVLVGLLIALLISFLLAKKNHLYSNRKSLEDLGEGEVL